MNKSNIPDSGAESKKSPCRPRKEATASPKGPGRIALVHQALRIVADKCDGARKSDGNGFSKHDTEIGKALAVEETLSPPQLAKAEKLVRKYRRQVPKELWEQIQAHDPARNGSDSDPAAAARAPVNAIADEITSKAYFARARDGNLHLYEGGVYVPKASQYIQRHVKRLLLEWKVPDQWASRTPDEVLKYIAADASNLWEKPPLDVINVKNGLLDVRTGRLSPHTHRFLSSVQIPVERDPTAKCPFWKKFVREVFPADARALGWEVIAVLLSADPSFQKSVLLLGGGGTGKSAFLSATIAFLGRGNVSTVSLHRLEDRFVAHQLFGKLANVCADLSSRDLKNTALFKALTGGDRIEGEQKYKPPYSFTPFAKLIFSANNVPRSWDASEAFLEQWLIIPCENKFRGTKREIKRRELDAQLADPKELSGVLNEAIKALRQLRRLGRFTQSKSTQRALREFSAVANHLEVWLERETVADPTGFVLVSELRSRYNQAAERDGRPLMTDAVRHIHGANEALCEESETWPQGPATVGLPGDCAKRPTLKLSLAVIP